MAKKGNSGSFKKGDPRAGRPPGVPNKSTIDVRAAIALIAERNVEKVEAWLAQIEDPAKRVDCFLRMIEYHIPKLSRSELTGDGGKPLEVQIVRFSDTPPK